MDRFEELAVAVSVTPLGNGAFRVHHDGGSDIVYVARSKTDRWIFWNGRVYRVGAESASRRETPAREKNVTSGTVTLTAPMPARVVQVLVQPKAAVKKGETLVLLEAMKMELPVRAPEDAEVEAVHCRVGELVDSDAPLVDLR